MSFIPCHPPWVKGQDVRYACGISLDLVVCPKRLDRLGDELSVETFIAQFAGSILTFHLHRCQQDSVVHKKLAVGLRPGSRVVYRTRRQNFFASVRIQTGDP